LTEARDLNLVCLRSVSSIDTRVEFIKRNLNLELDPCRGEVFNGGLDDVGLLGANRNSLWFRYWPNHILYVRQHHAVGTTGFEAATSRSQSARSTKLSYVPRSGL